MKMFSRQALFKQPIKPALNFFKVDNAAYIHFVCPHVLKLTSPPNKYFKNYRGNFLGAVSQVRYESVTSTTGQQASESSSISVPETIPDPPVPLSEITQSSVENLVSEPSFSTLGLGGWSPVGIVQQSLEFLHVSCGLPWWEAVVLGTFVIRLLMFPIVIISQRSAAKLNNNLPQVQLLQAKMSEARQRGDKLDAAKYSAEMMKFMNEKGVNPLKSMLPPLCQAPVFISVFLGLRGMSNLPVESLKTGGTLWFVDLTLPDQFYLLPIITSATLFCTIKLGAESGQTTQNMVLAKYFLSAIPLIMLPFIMNFPGLMLVYWTSSNFITLAQVGFLRIPKVREYFKIEKLIKHEKNNLAIKDKGFINNVKSAWNNMKITSELQQRERVDRMSFLEAGREPIKKTYKYNPTKTPTPIQAKKRV